MLSQKGCPHDLACELVGIELARIVGLRTPEYAVIEIPLHAPIELADGNEFVPGHGFITRKLDGMDWSGSRSVLTRVLNPIDLARLVVFDTWTLNCDRFRPRTETAPEWRAARNVFLERAADFDDQYYLTSLDHGCCFKCLADLTPAYLRRAATADTLYGYFPEFAGLARREHALQAVRAVQSCSRAQIDAIIERVPEAWLANGHRNALGDMIYGRIHLLERIIRVDFPAADLFDDQQRSGDNP
ncbi:HipA family kinase [Gemmata palustris]|uniref:HipA family kinase n=1 Tax=Gemmata palustris TaxID=2822762 RepID=UPI0028F3EE45|nr:HipA family kinase [Gemmata palustris]